MATDLTEGLVRVGEVWDRARPGDKTNLKVGTIGVESVGRDWIVLRSDNGQAIFVWFDHMNRTEVKLRLDEYRLPAKQPEGESDV